MQGNNTSPNVTLVNNNSMVSMRAGGGNTADKYSEEEYSNYIDSSDVVIQTYKNSSTVGLEKYFLAIEDWLDKPVQNPEDNKPYVIQADEGVGKKTLLVKWMEYHANKKKKYPHIVLSHFASAGGNNANYFFAIYRILNRLREALDIQQKVELLEEKLRKYFAYWLSHCSDKLEKQLKFGEKVDYDKVIIIIEGIDLFIDNKYNKEANVSFWLPRFFPEHIKLIVTCDKDSEANRYLRSIGCEIQNIPVDQSIAASMSERHSKRQLFISDKVRDLHLQILSSYDEKRKNQSFQKIFLCCLLPYPTEGVLSMEEIKPGYFDLIFAKLNYAKLKEVSDFSALIEFLLDFFSTHLMDKVRFERLIRVFTLTQKGLTIDELIGITGITDTEWKSFLAIFKMFILNFKGLWIMNNDTLKRVVHAKFKAEPEELSSAHQEIAGILAKITPNSIRKLEEETYHLFMSKDHFKLKEIISTIENFLLLFNPNNKYDLCRYWQNLEEYGFDPVVEYNKAIEGFEMHYHPSSQDVFRIIVQISRFLKEFSDFETYYTPEFRHPPVKGTYEELDDIGLLRELLGLQIFLPTEAEQGEKPDLEKFSKTPEEKIQSNKQRLLQKNKKVSTLKQKRGENDNNGTNNAGSKKKKGEASPDRKNNRQKKFAILSQIESLNVDIPSNREQFRTFYLNHIEQIMLENSNHMNLDASHGGGDQHLDDKDDNGDHEDFDEEFQNNESYQDHDQPSSNSEQHYSEQHGQKSFMDVGNESKKRKKKRGASTQLITMNQLRESYDSKERLPTNYYYKRWLWVQFPWACLALKCDYSAKLKECFSSPIEYMSVKKEKEFTKQALKIAIEAKIKKQMMYKRSSSMSDSISMIQPVSEKQHFDQNQTVGDSILIKTSSSYQALPSIKNNNGKSNLLAMQESQLSKYNRNHKSSSNLSSAPISQQFYLTNEFLKQQNLNKQIEQRSTAVNNNNNNNIQNNHNNATTLLNQSSVLNNSSSVALQNTSKVLEKSRVFKDKSRFFDPITSITDSQNISTVLPKLKGTIAIHSKKELYLLETQALEMKKELDNLHHANQSLAKQLKQLKVNEDNQNKYTTNPEKTNAAQKKVNDLEKEIAETEENYMLGLMQINRLKSICKICVDNKQQNEDWIRNLNFLLTNLKKMIKWEQDEIKQSREECTSLSKMNKEYIQVFDEKMQTQQQLITKINSSIKEKERFDHAFNRVDSVIEDRASSQVQRMKDNQNGHDKLKKQREKQSQLEKNSKHILEQLTIAKEKFNKLASVIDISDPNYSASEKFQSLLASMEKKQDLTAIVIEREDIIDSLQTRLSEKQTFLQTVKKAYPAQSAAVAAAAAAAVSATQINSERDSTTDEEPQRDSEPRKDAAPSDADRKLESVYEKKQREYDNAQRVRLSATTAIQTLHSKLNLVPPADQIGILNFDEEKLIKLLDEKVAIIKANLKEEEFAAFNDGDFEESIIYKALVKDGGVHAYMNNDDDDEDRNQSLRDI